MPDTPYTVVIGLEVHTQLRTQSKLFCGCSTRFGAEPNTQTCPVCLGLPGTLPVMNRRAFELSLRTATALNCRIAEFTKWDRKNYYYPDLPKGYQISQFDLPFSHDGWLEIENPAGGPPRRIGIIRAHLEEDAGKSMHDERHGQADSRVDLNRTGTPLLEIVSKPDLRSPEETRAYLSELKLLLTYLDVSDCNMQEGSLRVDANINLHLSTDDGLVATPIVEVKNMNSFRAVERAMAFEAERQYDEWQQSGHKLGDPGVFKRTFGWDDTAGVTKPQRQKEESSDYRYFPDPDLVPVLVSQAEIDGLRDNLGELPATLRKRLQADYGLNEYDSDVIVNQGREVARYFLDLADAGDAKQASNWLQQDVLRLTKEIAFDDFEQMVPPSWLADLLQQVKDKKLENNKARELLAAKCGMWQKFYEASGTLGKVEPAASYQNLSVDETIKQLGIEQLDESGLVDLAREIVAANPKVADDVRGGKLQAVGALIGQAKKRSPHANPGRIREILLELIQAE